MNKLWYLSQISLFEALTMEELQEIERMTPMTTIGRGELIQTPYTFREGLFLLKDGKLKLYKIKPEGKQFIVSILGAGNVFGEIDSFSLGTNDTFIETYHKIDMPLSHQEIANMIGSTRETVTTVLNELSKDGVIKTGRMSVHINLNHR
ncbi:Crp/Fnr family transcriptional regulator [Paenibacillus sp. N4]|uniref:Crp/Fnr family transcriptional regulator n=1 Tax=Paenibacillus vietnamensis TaxID=2590547 RepID=UPI001CD14D8E|nr:Crp/Fnr family transcriptional regulator [Paenibacillus vietnamensis]MCA0757240.1 Crp/Fnr family transcriptional regulator [Paenibacillus vietnamensis]